MLWRNAIKSQNLKVSSDKEDVEAGGAKVVETSCCKACKALASNVKLEAMEAEIAELKTAMKVKVRGSRRFFHPKFIFEPFLLMFCLGRSHVCLLISGTLDLKYIKGRGISAINIPHSLKE